jgi:hypothetical protein
MVSQSPPVTVYTRPSVVSYEPEYGSNSASSSSSNSASALV